MKKQVSIFVIVNSFKVYLRQVLPFTETVPITAVDEALLHKSIIATRPYIMKKASSKSAKKEWQTYFENLAELKETWFESLQDQLSNIERLHLHDTLRTRLVSSCLEG